jgi:GT2 family glycosyltransferase
MNIDVIILTDSSDVALTQRTIDTLHDSAIYENFCIQLVDSGSNDVNRYKGWTNYIHPESSFNYNKFLNIAIKYCTEDWVVISNDDVSYEKGWFSEIMDVHKIRPDIEAFSPKDPFLYAKYFSRYFIGGNSSYHESYTVTEALQGWCTVIKKCALDKILPFDELFDMYYQDNDYAERLKQVGVKHALVRHSIVCHMETLNVGQISEAKSRKLRIDEIKFRNKWNQ